MGCVRKKIEFASLPRFLSRGVARVVRPPTDLATYGGVAKSCRILAATFRILLKVSALYASTKSRWPKVAILAFAGQRESLAP